MFVKKDLRKIPQILSDATSAIKKSIGDDTTATTTTANDPHPSKKQKINGNDSSIMRELRLARRPGEFKGDISLLSAADPCQSLALQNIVRLSLYDCQIKNLDGIGSLSCSSLEELNLGKNPITHLPPDLSIFATRLKTLWCDDCLINGPVPDCVFALQKLECLRISNNEITSVPESIGALDNLKVLCLDGNKISSIPSQIGNLKKLESLLLRKNLLEALPATLPHESLGLLHVSSNKLLSLPETIVNCSSLETIYANANRIKIVPKGLLRQLVNLKKLNLSHNLIEALPDDIIERFGGEDCLVHLKADVWGSDRAILKDSQCTILLDGNAIAVAD